MTIQPDPAIDKGASTMGRPRRPDGADPLVRAQMHVEVIDDPGDAYGLAAEWAALGAAAGASPFSSPVYALAWWTHRGRGQLHVVTVRAKGELVALAPLHRRRLAGRPVLRWLGHGLGTVAELLVRPGWAAAASALWSAISDNHHVLLDLVEYRDDGAGLAALRRNHKLSSDVRLRDVCPVIELGDLSSADVLVERLHRRHPLRRSVERARRQLAAGGHRVQVEVAEDPDAVRAALPDLDHVFDAAEAHRPRLHLLRPPWRAFLLGLLDEWSADGSVVVHVLRLDGRAVAVEIAVVDTSTSFHWISRFSPEAATFSPGHLLMLAAVDHALDRGLQYCDLLLGDGPHKLPWATTSYDTLSVRASPRGLTARSAALDTTIAVRVHVARLARPRVGTVKRSV